MSSPVNGIPPFSPGLQDGRRPMWVCLEKGQVTRIRFFEIIYYKTGSLSETNS